MKTIEQQLDHIGGEPLEGSGFEDDPVAMTDDEMLAEMCQPVWPNLTKMIESGELDLLAKVAEFREKPDLTRRQKATLRALSAQLGI